MSSNCTALLRLDDYAFPRLDSVCRFVQAWRKFGPKALYKQFRFSVRRPFSRAFVEKFAPEGFGLEIGCGERSSCPVKRTVLSDRVADFAGLGSAARVFFPAENIPYADETFSFVCSEHVLEHLGNPIEGLLEWVRVVRPGGVIFLFLPHKDRTFDRLRTRTPLDHLVADFRGRVPQDDATHTSEFIANVIDSGLGKAWGRFSREELQKGGILHHHVWIPEDIIELGSWLRLPLLAAYETVPDRTDSFVVAFRVDAVSKERRRELLASLS